jgi:hypothetical protein
MGFEDYSMKQKVELTGAELNLIITALRYYGNMQSYFPGTTTGTTCNPLATRLGTQSFDPASDGPEVEILRAISE